MACVRMFIRSTSCVRDAGSTSSKQGRGTGHGMYIRMHGGRGNLPQSCQYQCYGSQNSVKELMFTIVSPAVRVPTCQAGGGIRNSVRRHVNVNEERETVRYFCLRFGCASQKNVQSRLHMTTSVLLQDALSLCVVLSVSPGVEAEREV